MILGLWQIKILNSSVSDPFNQICSDSYTIANRLSDFSFYRGLQTDDDSGLYHLLSTCPTLPTVGLAWLNLLCTTTTLTQGSPVQYVSGCAVSTLIDQQWIVVAHEIGHNFGMAAKGAHRSGRERLERLALQCHLTYRIPRTACRLARTGR